MRPSPDDPAARVEFVFRGDPDGSFTLPIEARPRTWVRALNIGGVATVISGAALAGPAAFIAPGPVGVLLTAFTSVSFGAASAVVLGGALAENDTPERPLKARFEALLAEARTDRPAPTVTVESSTAGIWPDLHHIETITDYHHLWSPCVRPDCIASPEGGAQDLDLTPHADQRPAGASTGGRRGPRASHLGPGRHLGLLRPGRFRARGRVR